MCWRGRGRGGARRWTWRAPSSATPWLFSLKPRSERANGSQCRSLDTEHAFRPTDGAAATATATTVADGTVGGSQVDRKSTRLNSSHSQISYAVFCLKKKKNTLHIANINL